MIAERVDNLPIRKHFVDLRQILINALKATISKS